MYAVNGIDDFDWNWDILIFRRTHSRCAFFMRKTFNFCLKRILLQTFLRILRKENENKAFEHKTNDYGTHNTKRVLRS